MGREVPRHLYQFLNMASVYLQREDTEANNGVLLIEGILHQRLMFGFTKKMNRSVNKSYIIDVNAGQ